MTKKRLGAPEKDFNWQALDGILQYGATKTDCAGVLMVSEDTIERRIKSKYGMTFGDYREIKKANIRVKLRQKQIQLALEGNVPLLIWLGKNELGQTDRQEIKQENQAISIELINVQDKT
jgi:hypothetical protein